jgi:phosphohistidine phosphatase
MRLILMRHAKSDYPVGVADVDRPLSPRGQRDAQAAGAWLRDRREELLGDQPWIAVSCAVRTQQTWQGAAESLPGLQAHTEPRLYEASMSAYLDLVREGLLISSTVLLVAHNPATEQVASYLAADDGSEQFRAMGAKFPTCAIAVIDVSADGLTAGCGSLATFAVPRG